MNKTVPEAPPFSGRSSYPLGGELIGPAWVAAWRMLSVDPGSWIGVDWLARAMVERGVMDKTARGLLARARACGVLDVRYRMTGTPARRRAVYRIARGR